MDTDQASKTIKWLDEERRKDKADIVALQERLAELELRLKGQENKTQEVGSELTGVTAAVGRLARIDDLLDGVRSDVTKQIEAIEKRRADSEREAEKLRAIDREGVNKSLVELRKGLEPLPQLGKDMLARREEENRISRLLRDFEQKMADLVKIDEDRARSQTALEEGRRQDARRVTDLQSEAADLRRKLDEQKQKIESLEDPLRRHEARMNELAQGESERRAQQLSFMEQQAVVNAERDRDWAAWQTRLDSIHAEAEEFSHRMDSYSESFRVMKKTFEDYQALIDRIERRIGEAGEIQRLAEDRFRQEWAAFQADEQKRWTTHMLMRDEQWRESDRETQKLLDRLAAIEEQVVEVAELSHVYPETDQRRLQSLLTLLREWLAEHEQTFTQVR